MQGLKTLFLLLLALVVTACTTVDSPGEISASVGVETPISFTATKTFGKIEDPRLVSTCDNVVVTESGVLTNGEMSGKFLVSEYAILEDYCLQLSHEGGTEPLKTRIDVQRPLELSAVAVPSQIQFGKVYPVEFTVNVLNKTEKHSYLIKAQTEAPVKIGGVGANSFNLTGETAVHAGSSLPPTTIQIESGGTDKSTVSIIFDLYVVLNEQSYKVDSVKKTIEAKS